MKDVVGRARRTWRRLGVASEVSDDMTAELRADIDAAGRDGVDPMALVGGDPEGFARSWASARGAVRPRWLIGSTSVLGLLGMLPGAAMMAVIPLAMTSPWFIYMVDPNNPTLACDGSWCGSPYWEPSTPVLWIAFGVALLAMYAGSLLAPSVWLRRNADPARPRTLKLLAIWLPVVFIVDGLVSRAFDGALGSSAYVDGHWRPTHMWPLLFGVLLAAGIAAIRWWAVGSMRRSPPPHAHSSPELEPVSDGQR
jgi:hypothetical protein